MIFRIFINRFLYIVGTFALISTWSFVHSAPFSGKAEINCYIRHLKSTDKLANNYPEFTTSEEIEDCESYLKQSAKEFYKYVALQWRRDGDIDEYMPCIMQDLKSNNTASYMFLKHVYEASETMTEVEKAAEIEKATLLYEDKAYGAMISCIYKEQLEEMFEELIRLNSGSVSNESRLMEDYCVRKHVVDNNLIDTTIYNIELNPENLNVDDINCLEVVKSPISEIRKTMIADMRRDDIGFNENQIQCAVKQFREDHNTDKLLRIIVLIEQNLTEEQKAEAKESYMKLMTGIMRAIIKCNAG